MREHQRGHVPHLHSETFAHGTLSLPAPVATMYFLSHEHSGAFDQFTKL